MNRRTALFAIAACMALIGCASPSPERKKEAAARMRMGVTYLEQKNLPSAMRELTKASELDPENQEIDMALGLVYQTRGDLEKAVEHFRNAIRKKSDYAEAHNNLGIVLSNLGRGEEAIREFEAAATDVMYPTPEGAYYNMGEEYRRRKNFAKAEEMYRKAISLNDRYVDAYLRLALLQGAGGGWADVARTLETCVRVVPGYGPAWMELGRAYISLGRKEDARNAFQNALANSADSALRKQASDYVNMLGKEKR